MSSIKATPIVSASSGNLRSVYMAKCAALGHQPNPECTRRLAAVDTAKGSVVNLSGITVDATFQCLFEVLVVATGVTSVALAGCNLSTQHVDSLAHQLQRTVGIHAVDLSGNPAVGDIAAQTLLELLRLDGTITELKLGGCGVTPGLTALIQEQLQRNHLAMSPTPRSRDGEAAADDDDPRHSSLSRSGRSFAGASFFRRPDDRTLSGSTVVSVLPPAALSDSSGVADRIDADVLEMLRDLSLMLMVICRTAVELVMWRNPTRSLVVAGLLCAITGVPFVDSSPMLMSTLLVSSFVLLQRRVRQPIAADSVPKWDEQWHRDFPTLSAMVLTEIDLRAADPARVMKGVKRTLWGVHRVVTWFTGPGKRIVGLALLATYLIAAYDTMSHLLFVGIVAAFAYIPSGRTRRAIKVFAATSLNPFADSGASPGSLVAQHVDTATGVLPAFQFTVSVLHLHGVVVRPGIADGDQFLPFVQVKYNRTSWVTHKVQEPYRWNATSPVKFTSAGAPLKMILTVFDDAPDVVGPAMQGFVIIDECTVFDRDIVVPLTMAQKEKSLLHSLIDDVQRHDAAARRKFAGGRPGGGTGGLPDARHGGGGGVFDGAVIETPGSLIIRLTPQPTVGGGGGGGAAAGGAGYGTAVDMGPSGGMGRHHSSVTFSAPRHAPSVPQLTVEPASPSAAAEYLPSPTAADERRAALVGRRGAEAARPPIQQAYSAAAGGALGERSSR